MDQSLGYTVDRKLCSELIVRLQTSYIFLPDSRSSEFLAEMIVTALGALTARKKSSA
jgi:hypothetical protein